MAIVTGKTFVGEAQLAQRQRSLASGGEAVGVAPNTIKLDVIAPLAIAPSEARVYEAQL